MRKGVRHECGRLCCSSKPRVRGVVGESLRDEEEIKTPFAIIKMRTANCIKNSKRRTFRMSLNDVNSLSHTKWNCKYRIVLAIVYWMIQIRWYIERERQCITWICRIVKCVIQITIVFARKYRRKIFYGEKREAVGKVLRQLREWKGVKIVEAEACPDHVQML